MNTYKLPPGFLSGDIYSFSLKSEDGRWPGTVEFTIMEVTESVPQDKEKPMVKTLLMAIYDEGCYGQIREVIGWVAEDMDPHLMAWMWMLQRPAPRLPPEPPRRGMLWHAIQAVVAWYSRGY
ncbi:MAG: hypothetical protein EPO08_20615 [Rhodospirillaceae bacterium]|nr:MAG: hypothetical protein EPO08_20615 [Rhodospirillaceae bacterium]